ncbi:MAG: sigma-54 factor interaction domain-containing protein, partial [Candidatus Zixiibacteriota bacterium]
MERSCPSKVIVFGARLFLDEWERLRVSNSDSEKRVTLHDAAVIPETDISGSTAFVDLDDKKFRSPEFLKELSTSFDKLQIIGISKSISPNQTIEVARLGVSEILTQEQYRTRVSSFSDMPEPEPTPIPTAGNQYGLSSIIGNSQKMNEIKQMIDNLSDVDYPNAILFGDTGTGKDLVAKVMHYSGVRKDKHFIEVNCSAIPDELFESELFGHKKGSFTGAKSDKIGLFEFADKGTIFLDEIGNLTISAQAKLLKILESRRLRPLGGVEEKDI